MEFIIYSIIIILVIVTCCVITFAIISTKSEEIKYKSVLKIREYINCSLGSEDFMTIPDKLKVYDHIEIMEIKKYRFGKLESSKYELVLGSYGDGDE